MDEATQVGLADGDLHALLSPRDAMYWPLLKPSCQRERLEEALGMTDESIHALLCDLASDDWARTSDDECLRRQLDNPSVRFLIRLVVPCFLRHGDTPQRKYRDATSRDAPDLDEMRDILKFDPGFIQTEAADGVLFQVPASESVERLRAIGSALGSEPSIPTLRVIKTRLAGLISFVGHTLGTPLKGATVRELFDIRARHRDPAVAAEAELPDSPESLQKMLRRQRKHWGERFTPDRNHWATVRALYAPAA